MHLVLDSDLSCGQEAHLTLLHPDFPTLCAIEAFSCHGTSHVPECWHDGPRRSGGALSRLPSYCLIPGTHTVVPAAAALLTVPTR